MATGEVKPASLSALVAIYHDPTPGPPDDLLELSSLSRSEPLYTCVGKPWSKGSGSIWSPRWTLRNRSKAHSTLIRSLLPTKEQDTADQYNAWKPAKPAEHFYSQISTCGQETT